MDRSNGYEGVATEFLAGIEVDQVREWAQADDFLLIAQGDAHAT
jgi:hypothetical protein